MKDLLNLKSNQILSLQSLKGELGDDGYEWITFPPNSQNHFYRAGSDSEWEPWDDDSDPSLEVLLRLICESYISQSHGRNDGIRYKQPLFPSGRRHTIHR